MIHIFDDIIDSTENEEYAYNSFHEEVTIITELLMQNKRTKEYSSFDLLFRKINLIIKMSYLFNSDNLKNTQIINLLEGLLTKECSSITDKTLKKQKEAEINSRIGILYRNNQDLDKSEVFLSKSLCDFKSLCMTNKEQHESSLAGAYWEMMVLYEQKGDFQKYQVYLEKALGQITPLFQNDNDTYRNCYVELLSRNIIKILSTNPNDIDEMECLAEYAYSIDKDSDTIKATLAIVLNQKANSLLQANEFKEALNIIDRALSLDSSFPEIFETKGQILLALGDREGALKQWQIVIGIDPLFIENHPNDCNLYSQLLE